MLKRKNEQTVMQPRSRKDIEEDDGIMEEDIAVHRATRALE